MRYFLINSNIFKIFLLSVIFIIIDCSFYKRRPFSEKMKNKLLKEAKLILKISKQTDFHILYLSPEDDII